MTLYWDRCIITDEKVDFNRPDKVLIDRGGGGGTALVKDAAVYLNHNLLKTETGKITKYQTGNQEHL
jgi:hypothetical protein